MFLTNTRRKEGMFNNTINKSTIDIINKDINFIN